MKVLHITPNTNGYEEVNLLANAVNEKNSIPVIEKNGEVFFTGGILLQDNEETRKILDLIPRESQYKLMCILRTPPYVSTKYYEPAEVTNK